MLNEFKLNKKVLEKIYGYKAVRGSATQPFHQDLPGVSLEPGYLTRKFGQLVFLLGGMHVNMKLK